MGTTNSKVLDYPYPSNVKYSHYDNNPILIPTTSIDIMTPITGSYSDATHTWEETKYIIYNIAEPSAGIDSPYKDDTISPPFFEFTDMQYYETPGDIGSVNIRLTCPVTYTVEPGVGTFIKSKISGNEG